MKTKLLLSILMFVTVCSLTVAQVPQGFNYQAIARLTTGDPIINSTLPVRITIQADSLGTSIIWQELHSSVTTNGFGLLTLILGKGSRQAASTVATFSAIDWTVSPKFIKTEINYSGWKTMGVTRLWSVPYSTIAGSFGGPVKKLAVKGETSLPDDALFEVKNKDGQTVFAVYNEGVRVYVSDGAKALKGGFAVGGFGTDKAESTKYMFVGKDSVRIYLDTNPLTKKLKGGFAVGGYDLTKAPPQEFLRVTQDSTRIYVNNNPAKGLKGGFAVGGFDVTKGTPTPFTSLTPKNYFIGHEGGQKITSGQYNSVVGYQGGKNITTGRSNVFMGYQAGMNTTNGENNVFLGHRSGYQNRGGIPTQGGYNVFIGAESGSSNTIGDRNVYIGYNAGLTDTSGFDNVYIGYGAGALSIAGPIYKNYRMVAVGSFAAENLQGAGAGTFVGWGAGRYNTTGHSNTFFGYESGVKNNTGVQNTYLGTEAGSLGTTGINNTMVGMSAGYNNNGNNNSYLGFGAGATMPSGGGNTILGTMSGQNRTGGSENVIIGYAGGMNSGAGNSNVFVGTQAGYNSTGNRNVFLGSTAGRDETGSYKLFIDNQPRANESDARAKSLIYGIFDANPANQYLAINGNAYIQGSLAIGTTASVTGLDVRKESRIGNNQFLTDAIELSYFGSGDRYTCIDFHGDNTYTDYGLRIDRAPGVNASSGLYHRGTGSLILHTNEAAPITFYTANAQRMTIDADGKVGIGTAYPTAKLEVNQINPSAWSGNLKALRILSPDNSYYLDVNTLIIAAGNTGYHFSPNGNTGLTISTPGYVGIGRNPTGNRLEVEGNASKTIAGSWLANSDVRIKIQIHNIENAQETLMKLHPVKFMYNEEWKKRNPSIQDEFYYNFIAQEFREVFPESVQGSGEYLEGQSEELLQLDSYNAQIVAIKALQEVILQNKEQQQQIESYKSENNNLKSQLQSLQEKVDKIEDLLAKAFDE